MSSHSLTHTEHTLYDKKKKKKKKTSTNWIIVLLSFGNIFFERYIFFSVKISFTVSIDHGVMVGCGLAVYRCCDVSENSPHGCSVTLKVTIKWWLKMVPVEKLLLNQEHLKICGK